MKTQTQHFYFSHRQLAAKNETFNFLRGVENPITPEELEKLKKKNFKLWGGFKLTGAS